MKKTRNNTKKAKTVKTKTVKAKTVKRAKTTTGGPLSKEHKAKLSAALKGLIPWNKGKKTGVKPWNAGKKTGIEPWNKGKHTGLAPANKGKRVKKAKSTKRAKTAKAAKPAKVQKLHLRPHIVKSIKASEINAANANTPAVAPVAAE
ncbi:MAG: NUMOD3 domain-containing DNA-binding protein [Patescibacteria group bacterium]|jgi:hypothetical protein